jgi:hypothetical protein
MAKPKINRLSNNENHDFDIVAVYDYNAIADNATVSNQTTIGQIPAGGGVEAVYVYEAVALAGASDITLDVGTTASDPDEFINALDVDAMSAPVYNTGDAFEAANAEGLALVGKTNTATDIVVEWNGTVASLTAGEVIIGVKLVDPGRFSAANNG